MRYIGSVKITAECFEFLLLEESIFIDINEIYTVTSGKRYLSRLRHILTHAIMSSNKRLPIDSTEAKLRKHSVKVAS